MAEDEFLTVAEVAARLKLNPQTIRNWINAGTLPAYRVGRRVRISVPDFNEKVSAGATGESVATALAGPTAEEFWLGTRPVGEAVVPQDASGA